MRELTCREFDEAVHEFVRMELLDVGARDAVLEHAGRCAACAERMADATALAEAIEAMGSRAKNLEAPPRVQSVLLATFQDHRQHVSWRRALEWATAGAGAAALLVFLWTVGGRSKGPSVPAPGRDASSESRNPVEVRETTGTNHGGAVSAGASEAASQSSKEESSPASSETYVASDFVPVPFAGGISADDPGMIVRVQLTRASLAQLGYPVAATPDEEMIPADVLVGEDGWPRGVKLVQAQ